MSNKKHYVLVSVTLGAIAAASALLIAGTNMLTKDKIRENEIKKVHSGIASIFGEKAEVSKESKIDNSKYEYVEYVYEVKDSGYVFRTTGSNMYGKISLIIGFNYANEFVALSTITNEQTYASTLDKNYLDLVNQGKRDIDDVSCGATYGAKLVRDMINEAKLASEEKVWTK